MIGWWDDDDDNDDDDDDNDDNDDDDDNNDDDDDDDDEIYTFIKWVKWGCSIIIDTSHDCLPLHDDNNH